MNKIKNYFKYNLQPKIVKNVRHLKSKQYIDKFEHLANKPKILISLIPNHHNLGDHAIAYASIEYLKNNYPNHEIIELSFEETYKYGKSLKQIMNNEDLTFIIGGGNMGNQYMEEENIRRYMIKHFKHTQTISLPQTIYFTKDKRGNRELKKSMRIYNSNKNLRLIAREDKSYEDMKDTFKECKVIKCPDIVFYLNNKLDLGDSKRTKIMTCLREDKETYLSINEKKEFISRLEKQYEHVDVTDTISKSAVLQKDRKKELFKIWKSFSSSKVVITDRLHGMIFCVITKTPCIVIRSLDHKIVESYKWIKELNHIRMVDKLEFENIKLIIDELSELDEVEDIDFDIHYFNNLLKALEVDRYI